MISLRPTYGPQERGTLYFDDTRNSIDMQWLMEEIHATYFGKERTVHQMMKLIDNSLCYSLHWDACTVGNTRQVGFARVVTDYVSFGWLADVIIDRQYRRRGMGTELMRSIVEDPRLAGITLNLGTRDAHAFYAQFGFERCEQMMRRAK